MIRTIPLKIQNEYITGDKGMIGAAGSHNDVILRMEFSGMWDGLTKMVQFRDALGEATIEVLLTADMLEADDTSVYLVPVPNGAKKYAGEMTLCIKGAAVSAQKETRATLAVYGRFTVAESKWSADAETEADVPASNVEKLQGQIDNVLATIVDARKAATEAAKSAEGAAWSQSRAQTSEKYAGEYAQGAADSAISAANSATRASDSATAAASSATAAKAREDAAAGFTTNAARYSEDAALSQSRALASERYAGEYAQDAANSATAAATSAQTAQSAASTASTAAEAASGSASKAQESAAAADNSEKKATAAATKAEAASNHPPRINSNGKWELWDATKNAYVATEYTAIGKDGTKWWTYNGVFASLGEKIWVSYHDIPNASIGDFVLHTRNDAGVVYEITGRDALNYGEWLVEKRCVLRGADGTTPHIGDNGNWYIGDTDTGVSAGGSDLPAVTSADAGKYLHVNASTKELEWAEAGNGTPLTKDSIVTALGYTPLNPSVDNVTLKVNGTKGLSLTSAYSIGLDITADTARMNMTPVARGAVASPSPAVKFKGDASSVADWGADKNVILTGIADGTEDNDAATVRQLKGYVASESPGWAGGDMLMMRDGDGFIGYAEMKPDTVGAMPNVPVNDAAKDKYLHVNASTKELEWAEAGESTTPHIGENGNWYIGSTDTGKPSRGAAGAPGADGKDGAAGTPGKDGTNGTNGITPTIGANGNWFLGSTDTGKPSRGATGAKGDPGDPGAKGDPGEPGAAGEDGITPTIGTNGNWYLGATDTGKPSRGATGAKGDPGTDYVLTSADKAEIAALVLAEIPNGDEVAYG